MLESWDKDLIKDINEIKGDKLKEIRTEIELLIYSESQSAMLERYFSKILEVSQEYDKKNHKKLINFLMDCLKTNGKLNKNQQLNIDEINTIKVKIIDFLYVFKDRYPYSNSENEGPMHNFDIIMKFMTEYKYSPSRSLYLTYMKSKTTKKLVLPEYKVLKEILGMEENIYLKIEEKYKSMSTFVYLFNPELEIETKELIHDKVVYGVGVGYFKKGTNKPVGAAMCIQKSGDFYQGYWKENKKEYFGREYYENHGDVYEGGWVNDIRSRKVKMSQQNGKRRITIYNDNGKADGASLNIDAEENEEE